MLMDKHTFAVCAYKESPYLEACIQSLLDQTVRTDIIVATSTPNKFISDICENYNIPLYVNKGEGGITQDWNFAYNQTDARYITIAHQDDIYDCHYTEEMYKLLSGVKKPIIFFTDYSELRNGEIVHDNKLLKIKRLMLIPLRCSLFWKSRFVRRRILSLGSPICCPSVTFDTSNCPNPVFQHGFRADEDWEAWERLSRRKGAFVYSRKILTFHRIHQESETSKILEDNARHKEDFVMFCKFWPKSIARFLTKVYGTSEKSNEM